jgi:hypothetical protein
MVSAQKWSFFVSTKVEFFIMSAQNEFPSCQHKNGVFMVSAQKYSFYRISTK